MPERSIACPDTGLPCKCPRKLNSPMSAPPTPAVPTQMGKKCCCCAKKKKKYCQPPRPESYAPRTQYTRPCQAMEKGTIYKLSYPGCDGPQPRSSPIIQPGNLTKSCGRMSGDTVQKLSYLPVCALPADLVLPCHHDLTGKGPMQDLTTQKHDYVPKNVNRTLPIRPIMQIMMSTCPIEDKTIQRLSYPCPGNQARAQPYRPIVTYKRPNARMECATVQKLSYLPNAVRPKWIPPWALKPVYVRPCTVMEGMTIQKSSYIPPGVECGDDYDCCGADCNKGCQCPVSMACNVIGGQTYPRAAV